MHRLLVKTTILILCFSFPAQTKASNIRDFSIMIIPYLEPTEKISQKLQQQTDLRMTIATLQDAFVSKGLKITDFAAKYQKYQQDLGIKGPAGDIKAIFVEYASPDIFVEVEMQHLQCGDGTHKARIRLKAYLTATAELMAERVSDSNCFVQEADYFALIRQATNKILESYINDLQNALMNMIEAGQPLQIHIKVDNKAGFDFNSIVLVAHPSNDV